MERLPHFLVEQIFDELSICDAIEASFVSRSWRAALMPYLYSTYNINSFFKCFPQPEAFLRLLRETGGLLCGYPALGYFLPAYRGDGHHIVEAERPSRFYTPLTGWRLQVLDYDKMYVHDKLLQQSFVYAPGNRGLEYFVYEYESATGKKGKLEVHLHLYWGTIYGSLFEIPCAAERNFLTGWGAVSLYLEETFQNRGWLSLGVLARKGELSGPALVDYANSAAERYAQRGIKVLVEKEGEKPRKVFMLNFPSAGKGTSHAYFSDLRDAIEGLQKCQVQNVEKMKKRSWTQILRGERRHIPGTHEGWSIRPSW